MTVFAGARVVTPAGVLEPGWVQVRDGRIEAVGAGRPADGPVIDLGGGWLLPGFIDLHVHGGGGHDFAASPEDLAAGVAFHRRHGTTRTLVSLVTAPVEQLCEQLRWIAALTRRGAHPDGHVLGAHLEGPFLSAARCGAQNVQHMLAPSLPVWRRLLAAGQGSLRTITIAPELPGALDLIAAVAADGVIPAIGHTDANYAQAVAGFAAGGALATHLFNGMRPLHHREPGAIGAALERHATVELICDGVHVHPALIRTIVEGPAHAVFVTDAIDAAGIGDGDYVLGGQAVRVADGMARLVRTGSLAGSTATMDMLLRVAVRQVGLPVEVAVLALATEPAAVLGLADRCGAIAPGLAADLVVLDDELMVRSVIESGGVASAVG